MFSKSYTKYIQSLQHKKARDEAGLFVAEGPKLIPELLSADKFNCRQVFGTASWINANAALLKQSNVEIITVKDFELEKISGLSTANEVLGIFEKTKAVETFSLKGKITLVLDAIQDPGNLGTIIRIADWYAVEHIICSETCADMYNPKVVQSTMGSIARVNIIYTDLQQWIKTNAGIAVFAAALKGRELSDLKNIQEAILIIGNESKGISKELLELATEKITITKKGHAESLNAAVATGIILSHLNS
ncbi:MAG: RNA methyltransferase [Ferruginibacter sp.]